jgi:hypothetical protein
MYLHIFIVFFNTRILLLTIIPPLFQILFSFLPSLFSRCHILCTSSPEGFCSLRVTSFMSADATARFTALSTLLPRASIQRERLLI